MSNETQMILSTLDLYKSRKRWRWLAIAAVAVLLLLAAWQFGGAPARGPHVARLEVSGLITGDEQQLQLIRDMASDDNVKALIVRINSPGGTTVGSEALYDELRAFGSKKPLVAVMDSVAASGGYITALAADRIYARGNTITGSIGVIFTYPDVSQLLGTVGVKMEEVKSGPLKAEPSGTHPVPEAARIVMQEMVDDGFRWFKGLVAERRKLDAATVDRLSDGRVYSGRQALNVKLIDALGTETDARAYLSKEKAVDEKFEIITREPDAKKNAPRLSLAFGKAAASLIGSIFGVEEWQEKLQASKLDGLLVLWHPAL